MSDDTDLSEEVFKDAQQDAEIEEVAAEVEDFADAVENWPDHVGEWADEEYDE